MRLCIGAKFGKIVSQVKPQFGGSEKIRPATERRDSLQVVNPVCSEMAEIRRWHGACFHFDMLKRIGRWFIIKSRFDAIVVTYALALGAVSRGEQYLRDYPGFAGYLLFASCTGAVFMAGAKIMEATRPDAAWRKRRDDPATSSKAGIAGQEGARVHGGRMVIASGWQ